MRRTAVLTAIIVIGTVSMTVSAFRAPQRGAYAAAPNPEFSVVNANVEIVYNELRR